MNYLQVKNINGLYFYYFITTLLLLVVVFSEPFLRYPYDIFAHLIAIDEKYHGLTKTSTSIQPARLIWHTIWAKVFQLMDIGSIDFFLRAKIIHVVQTFISLFSIYFFSKVILRNLFDDISSLTLKYLSLWSVLIWITIYATFSMHYHLIWNLWYSVSYHITLPLFFYITGLSLVLLLEKVSLSKKLFYLFQITLISLFMLQAHPMELIYYGMYLLTFALIYWKKTLYYLKQYYIIFVLFVGSFIYLIGYYDVETVQLFTYFNLDDIGSLYGDLRTIGERVVAHYNRAEHVINELMYVILFISVFISLFILQRYKGLANINIKLLIFIVLTSMFIFIPLYTFSAGFFALITKEYVVHRVYFSSSLFILLPIFVYYLSRVYNLKIYLINIILITIISMTLLYSKYSDLHGNTYYKNIKSLINSFTTRYTFHLSEDNLDYIANKIKKYEADRPYKNRDNFYYAREDIAFVIKYLYRKRVFLVNRRVRENYPAAYKRNLKYTRYNLILFKTKKDFPENPHFK